MSKLPACIAFAALAGCASTNGWRAQRIDGTTQATFEESVAAFQQTLSPNRRLHLEIALQEIWSAVAGSGGAEAGVEEAAAVYFARLDGLGYKEIIRLGGPEARETYNALATQLTRARNAQPSAGFRMYPPSQGFRAETMINTFGPYPGVPTPPR